MSLNHEDIFNKVILEQNNLNLNCHICKNILIYPQECTICKVAFCLDCLNKHIEFKYECPANKCKDNYFKESDGLYINTLNSLIFKCKLCCKTFQYLKYLNYLMLLNLYLIFLHYS